MNSDLRHPLHTLREDQAAFLVALLEEEADFIIVGGYAMRCLGSPRYTADLDIVVEQSEGNVRRIRVACERLPCCNIHLITSALLQPEKKLIWKDVEIFSSMKGLSYPGMRAEAGQCEWRGQRLNFMSKLWMQQSKMLAQEALDRQVKWSTDAEDLEFLHSHFGA